MNLKIIEMNIDKIRDKFESQFSTSYSKNKRGVNPYVSWEGVFNFFLPYLQKKQVEVSSSSIEEIRGKFYGHCRSNYLMAYKREHEGRKEVIEQIFDWFIENSKPYIKQGIAPCKEVEKKYRVGKHYSRAILEIETGHEHLLFPVGSEKACKDYCDYLNNL